MFLLTGQDNEVQKGEAAGLMSHIEAGLQLEFETASLLKSWASACHLRVLKLTQYTLHPSRSPPQSPKVTNSGGFASINHPLEDDGILAMPSM